MSIHEYLQSCLTSDVRSSDPVTSAGFTIEDLVKVRFLYRSRFLTVIRKDIIVEEENSRGCREWIFIRLHISIYVCL